MTRISSKKYLAGSRGQTCTLRIPGVCNNDPETVVPAHIRDRHKGGGTKASDISVANACSSCHAVFDGQVNMRTGTPIDSEAWYFYALRGLQETLEQRIEAGLLVIPQDVSTPLMARPTKPRKPKAQRKAIPSRPFNRKPKP